MGDPTFFWHDYETFGRLPRRDRPAQFAGVRTDAELNEVDAPCMLYCRPAPDFLPEPEACLLTGIVPQTCLEHGVAEHAFAAAIEAQLARPGTVGVGYNSIRFDDEVTRHLFWRCLIDPYEREHKNECGRWDLLDVVRCTWALRPDGIEWPLHADGKPSFRLEDLARANGVEHAAAHDALADVRATIALARLIRARQPRLWAFCLQLRDKNRVLEEMAAAQQAARPLLHISGRYGTEQGGLALVWPLAAHPRNRNEVIVWDLASDPAELLDLDVATLRLRLFTRTDELPAGVARLPIKTIHLNRSPVVVSNLNTLSAAARARFGVDVERACGRVATAAAAAASLADAWAAVYARPAPDAAADVDEDLYGGLVGNEDRRMLQRLRALAPEALAGKRPEFSDARLGELLFRYRARNFPATLSDAEQRRWLDHCARRLHEGAADRLSLEAYFDRIDALAESADERSQRILEALIDYATEIAPERKAV